MRENKKTWAETHDWKPKRKDDLGAYLRYAVHKTCRELGWDWGLTRQTDVFMKIETWAAGMLSAGCDFYFYALTPEPLVKHVLEGVLHMTRSQRMDTEGFIELFYHNLEAILKEWLTLHPNDETVRAWLDAKKVNGKHAPTPRDETKQDAPAPTWRGNGEPPKTRAEKRRAIQAWDAIPLEERPLLTDWLIENFGTDRATENPTVLDVTFHGWRRYLKKLKANS